MVRIGMMLGDRYEILEKVGTGGMSDVYKARCHKLNRFVAVKVLKQEFSENTGFVSKFRVEAQAAAGLMHPNIVSVYDVGEEDGVYYIVMELIEGITLKNYIEKKARLSLKEAISIAIQVSMGIEAAHNNHIIHRDIKPQNIIISKEGKVKVTDFGIAKAATSNTITSNVMGSVHYTSPEQARGGFSDEKSDIYSLGCTMFEMLTGHVPFDGETTVAIAIKHIQEDMPSCREFVAEIPLSVENIIFKATQKSPDRRYQTMGELIVDLKKSLLTPEEDFVKVIPVDANGATRVITEEDMEAIKERTGTIKLPLREEAPVRRPIRRAEEVASKPERKRSDAESSKPERERKNEKPKKTSALQFLNLNDDEPDLHEDEFDDDDIDPKMEKITTILFIVAAVIIGILVLILGAFFIGKINNNKPDKAVSANTSENSDTVEMINVVGMDIEEAKKTLNAMMLGTSVSYAESDEVEENQIISQEFEKGEMVKKYTTVKLVVCSGKASVEVLDVSGKTAEEAKKALEEAGFSVVLDYANSETVEKDLVISTNPSASSKVAKNTRVTVIVSEGPEIKMVSVPDLRGMTESAAKSKLESLKLKAGTVSETNSDTVTAGCVVSQSKNPGDSVEEGAKVDIVLSIGPKIVKYKYTAMLNAPTGYTSGNVTITITAADGEKRTFTATAFPCAVNEAGFKVATGTITYAFNVTTLTGETDAEGNALTKTEIVTSQPIAVTFEKE